MNMKQNTFDFQDRKGPVPAHRHQNPDGTPGGWVADTAMVAETATIGPDALVYGNAQVRNNAQVYGNVQVFDSAEVCGNSKVFNDDIQSPTPTIDIDSVDGTGLADGFGL